MGFAYTALEPEDLIFPQPIPWPEDLDWTGWPDGWDWDWSYPGPEPPGYEPDLSLNLTGVSSVAVHNCTTGNSDSFTIRGDYMDYGYPGYQTAGMFVLVSATDIGGISYTFSVGGQEATSHRFAVGLNSQLGSSGYGYVQFSINIEYLLVGLAEIANKGWVANWTFQLQTGTYNEETESWSFSDATSMFDDAQMTVSQELTYSGSWSENIAKPSSIHAYVVSGRSSSFDISITDMRDYDGLLGTWLGGQTLLLSASDAVGGGNIPIISGSGGTISYTEGVKCEALFSNLVLDISELNTSSTNDADLNLGSGAINFSWTVSGAGAPWNTPSGSFSVGIEEVLDPPNFSWPGAFWSGNNVTFVDYWGNASEGVYAICQSQYVKSTVELQQLFLHLFYDGGNCTITGDNSYWWGVFLYDAVGSGGGGISPQFSYSSVELRLDWPCNYNPGGDYFKSQLSSFGEGVVAATTPISGQQWPYVDYIDGGPPIYSVRSVQISSKSSEMGFDRWRYYDVEYISGYDEFDEPIYAYKNSSIWTVL